jgi:hypothetical protein
MRERERTVRRAIAAVGVDERRPDGVHRAVVDTGFQLDHCDVDADEVIVGVPVMRFELCGERLRFDGVNRCPRADLIAFDIQRADVNLHRCLT